MNKFDEKVALYKKFMDDRDIRSNSELLTAVTKGLGPSIYKKDAETVSGSDPRELETVKKNFLMKKLGLADTPELNEKIGEVMERIGKSERNKYRAVVYYMLVKKFNKESFLVPTSDVLKSDIPDFLDKMNLKWQRAILYRTVVSDLSDLPNVESTIIVTIKSSSSLFSIDVLINLHDLNHVSTKEFFKKLQFVNIIL